MYLVYGVCKVQQDFKRSLPDRIITNVADPQIFNDKWQVDVHFNE